MAIKWLRGPTCPGVWWYWILGSGRTRHQRVFCWEGKLQVFNNEAGPTIANQTMRLWCLAVGQPKLPPVALRKRLEWERVGRIVRSER